tara:strand:+ start:1058 stop:1441 length:384 start_codon:yes stop_codon:yes gene_type:complete
MDIIFGTTYLLTGFPAYETTKFDYFGKHFEVYVDWEDKEFRIWVWEKRTSVGGCGYRQIKSGDITSDMIKEEFDCFIVDYNVSGLWILEFDSACYSTTDFASSLLEDAVISTDELPIHVEHNLRHLA